MIPLAEDYAWDNYKAMVAVSCMKILVIYAVAEVGQNLSDIDLNRMPQGCDGHDHRSGVGSHNVPSHCVLSPEIYDTMTGS